MQARILVIEADPAQRLGLRSALAAAGFGLGSAADAAEAGGLLQEGKYDLVLLGTGRTEQEARATAASIQADQVPPVVALLALPDCVVGREVLGTGVPRAVDLPAVLAAITRYMRFAPSRSARSPAELERLVADWAEYEGQPGPA